MNLLTDYIQTNRVVDNAELKVPSIENKYPFSQNVNKILGQTNEVLISQRAKIVDAKMQHLVQN